MQLANHSPVAVEGKLIVPDELTVQPSGRWRLETGKSLSLTLIIRKSWREGQMVWLTAQPVDGDPCSCAAFWVGREPETALVPDTVGVDFGTSKFAIAYRQHGSEVELLRVQDKETVPSVLVFLPDQSEPLFGQDAHARLGDPTALPVQGIKLLLRANQLIEWQGRTWTPSQLAQRFLRFLKQQLDAELGDDAVCVKR